MAFLKPKNYDIEDFENHRAVMADGAYQHIALDVKEVDQLFEICKEDGYSLLHDSVQYLPFWDNGTKFFMILGPNQERIEFCHKLKERICLT